MRGGDPPLSPPVGDGSPPQAARARAAPSAVASPKLSRALRVTTVLPFVVVRTCGMGPARPPQWTGRGGRDARRRAGRGDEVRGPGCVDRTAWTGPRGPGRVARGSPARGGSLDV